MSVTINIVVSHLSFSIIHWRKNHGRNNSRLNFRSLNTLTQDDHMPDAEPYARTTNYKGCDKSKMGQPLDAVKPFSKQMSRTGDRCATQA